MTRRTSAPASSAPPPVVPAPVPPQPAHVQPAAVAPTQPAARPPVSQPDQPAARLPTESIAQPKTAAASAVVAREAQPGDRICGNCSEANDPTRKFCRRCGTTLVNAQVVGAKKLPWWKRLFRRQPKEYAAGERTKSISQRDAVKCTGVVGLVEKRQH